MRLSEQNIKARIVHPEEEVRLVAAGYFANSFSRDDTVMPRVIQAVEHYGRETAFCMLRDAEHLTQTPATLDWLMAELRRDYNCRDVEQDNYRFSLGLILLQADPHLLAKRHREILHLPAFPEELQKPLDERLKLHFMGFPEVWAELERLGRETMRRGETTSAEYHRFDRIIHALVRHPETADLIHKLLQWDFQGRDGALMEWLEPEIVQMAGELRMEAAIPWIIARGDESEEAVIDEIGRALGKIGTDAVVTAIAQRWESADSDLRHSLCEALEHIHTDLCCEKCLELLAPEEDFEVALALGYALMAHFCFEGIEPVRGLVAGDDGDLVGDQFDLRYRLIAAATVMEATFPEYNKWHADALKNNYGRKEGPPARLADAFRRSG